MRDSRQRQRPGWAVFGPLWGFAWRRDRTGDPTRARLFWAGHCGPRFVSAIYSLDDVGESELLLDIFALSDDTSTMPRLLQRRTHHGSKINRRTDSVARREEAALDHLHSRLVSGTYAQSPLILHVPEMHGGIVYEHTSTRIIVENRKWRETLEYYRFANMHGELDYVTITRSYEGTVTSHPNGAFKVNTRPVAGAGYNDHFWHLADSRTQTSPMVYGRSYDLRFRVTPTVVDHESQQPITLASRAFHQRSLLASIQVKFVGDRPAEIWKFERASPYARPNEANRYSSARIDEHGVSTLRQRDIHGGLFSGFGWRW